MCIYMSQVVASGDDIDMICRVLKGNLMKLPQAGSMVDSVETDKDEVVDSEGKCST